MRWIPALALIVLAAPAPAEMPPRAVATVGMIGAVAVAVAGPCVAVETMMAPGVDPHLYRPSASDVRAVFDADILLYVGLNLEGQLGAVFGRLEGRKPALAVAEAAVPATALIAPDDADGADPHVWMDAGLWAGTAPLIAEAFAEIAPDCAAAMAERAEAEAAQIRALDAWIAESVATIPEESRVLVTAHDAFAYYGRAYGLQVVGIQGVSTEAEAGIGDIRETVDRVIDAGVPAIFVESTINPRTVEAVIAAAEARGHALRIGGALYSDAMGEAGTVAGTYVGMLWSNTRNVTEALGGTPPPLPAALGAFAARWGIDG